ncbi:MAG TPA: PAS domain S-box protein [Polyangiaceae bacterium]|nr:PAS domain S-box protein [Polyangiaceae bacterium]
MPAKDGKFSPEAAGVLLEAIASTADAGGIGLVATRVGDPPEVLFANTGLGRLLGYELDELLGIRVWDHFDTATRVTLKEMRRRADEGAPLEARFEIQALHKNGSRVPLEVVSHRAIVDGQPTSVTFLYDITTRKRAAEALAASEARFRTVVESAPDGVAILRGPTVVYLNGTAAEMLGYDRPGDGVGKPIADMLHPEDAPRAAARIGELFRTGVRHADPAEYRSRRIDGREITVEISSIPIEYEGGPAVLAFARDITERKAMQEKMVQADRLAAVGTLAAGIAHEINNPLAYVLLGLQYLERELPRAAKDPVRLEEALARLREVRGGAERVGSIVRDLKTFARADEVARGPVDLRAALEAALKIADNEVRHRAALVRDYEDGLPAVDANAARLEQVFLNLLVNAAHAVSDRDPATNELRVVLRRGGPGRVIAEVTDNGTGIAPEILARVFDPFFTTKPIGVGTGLGLPICRSIVEGFGGTMTLESTPGVGTTVRIDLPTHAREAATETREPTRRSSRPPKTRGRILVVDDEPLVAQLLHRMLQSAHDVSIATSGAEALAAIERTTFDAIVCDVMMPGITGMDLYATLSVRNEETAKRMVFMTGGAFVPRVAEFLASVPNPKLEKPFELGALSLALQRVIER